MRLFFAILISVLALLLAKSTASSQPEPAPYLYYFSEERHAFVIERADGTESRLLGQGIIPINAVGADGAWSASGEYFAWATRKRWLESVDPRQTNEAEEAFGILRSDGSPVPIDLPAGIWRHRFIWSPTGDHVLLTLQNLPSPAFYLLINPKDGMISQPFLFDEPPETASLPGWTLDGKWLVLTYFAGEIVNDKYESFELLEAINQDGRTRKLKVECGDYCTSWRLSPPVSINNEMLFIDPSNDRWSLYNLDTDTFTPVDAETELGYTLVNWSPDGAYALLRGGARTWLLDVARREIHDVGDYSDGDDFEVRDPWSPDGRYAAWIGSPSTVFIWDRDTGERHDFPVKTAFKLSWSTDSQTIFVGSTGCCSTFDIVDAETRSATTITVPKRINAREAVPSPDDVHWGLFTGSDGKAEVLNLETGILDSYTQHAIYSMEQRPGLYVVRWQWSDNGDWFIVGQIAVWSGGGAGPVAFTVYQLGQLQGRDLAFDSGNVNWLPDAAAQQLGLSP
jgi:WD40 repeat protein